MPELPPLTIEGVTPYPEEFARRYRERGHWIDQTHAELLFETVSRHPERTAIIAGERRLSYAELGEQVLRVAAGFEALGIGRGDRVVVHLPNVPEYVPVVFGLFELGAIPVFALAAHRRNEIEYFIEFSEAVGYVTADRHDGTDLTVLAEELLAVQPSLRVAVVVGAQSSPIPSPEEQASLADGTALGPGARNAPDSGEAPSGREPGNAVLSPAEQPSATGGLVPYQRLAASAPLQHERRSLPSDLAFLQLSGGTTGRPKLIPRTHDDYLFSVRESNRIAGVTEQTVQLVALPISHNFTMSSPGILGVLAAGGTIVLAPNGSPDAAFPLIERHRVTQASLVPPLALAWLNSSLQERYDLSSLEVIQVGGAKFSEEAARRVRPELGATLQQVFGMAEGLVNYTRLDDDEATIVSTQGLRISSDDEVRVVDEEDREVPAGEPGNLLVRGPYTIRGYFRAPEHNARSFTAEGFYRTGDIVRQDERGYLTVLGRSKDQINRGGEKIAPEEVENLLLGHEAVHDVSVVGVPDALLGERTKAYVVLREGAEPRALTVLGAKRFLRDRGLAAYKIPDIVEFVAEFPQTGVGKVSKREQRER